MEDLKQIIEQIEHLLAEKSDLQERIKDVYSHAKAQGFEPAIVRKVIALRAMTPDDRAEQEAILEMYKSALGM